jgi:hypothetical protein
LNADKNTFGVISMSTIGSTEDYTSGLRYNGTEKATVKRREAHASSAVWQDKKSQIGSDTLDTIIDSRPSAATLNFQKKLSALSPTAVSSVLKGTPVWEMSEDFFQRIVSSREMLLEANYTRFPEAPDLSDYGGIKPYATVVVGGQIVATIDNQGGVSSDDALGRRLHGILAGEVDGTNGPNLAHARADQIAELLGGRVVKSETALTQAEFSALPKIEQPKPWIDYDAMRADPEYGLIQEMKHRRAEYLASQ